MLKETHSSLLHSRPLKTRTLLAEKEEALNALHKKHFFRILLTQLHCDLHQWSLDVKSEDAVALIARDLVNRIRAASKGEINLLK